MASLSSNPEGRPTSVISTASYASSPPLRPPLDASYSIQTGDGINPHRPSDMDSIPWYHFNISRHVAESLLISTGEDGSYLLRDSSANPGEYSLSVRSKDSVKHFTVRYDGESFTFGFGKFSNVQDLISHFESKPVIGGDSGILTVLKFPYPRSVKEPEVYDSIRVHAEGGVTETKAQPTFAIASKEGYLTKLGQHRKNWKTRWFVLYKNEFSYYKTREDKTPIRVINLKDVSMVMADNSQYKNYCFKVVSSWRTFFLYATSAQEAEDWIKILRWKLESLSGTET
ncbi:PREDICTED: dual adapter for phosphotyrosine and 3-phosphotyrosine and 3-phosphoinositide-like [Amphimedon queenslandica]|uniref:Dual adapter for phosphotyrosine and 3-phosphotyrosine and 3-phosphoinositide n=1 Tax=Amphimedon queenslandica TaxID=400682 RepID=A0A1X7VX56_AMPQE|nr:PREDICTED: dual adapter for phosphotyrosine and 3-phosphotyrosine and 3-phosphoinositide-like [Amphimedon queenslandica]|eukprot:XP_003382501.1 PREDICTED: dual adapter for phosphotyrosine and 3-phosphotyrosine and 3-phosphoinositide-like [Amphimedon queenslandica]